MALRMLAVREGIKEFASCQVNGILKMSPKVLPWRIALATLFTISCSLIKSCPVNASQPRFGFTYGYSQKCTYPKVKSLALISPRTMQ